jgi:hypothetical protein
MSLLKEISGQVGLFTEVTCIDLNAQNVNTPIVNARAVNAQDVNAENVTVPGTVVTANITIIPSENAQSYVLTSNDGGEGTWQLPALFAYGQIGGSDSIVVANGALIPFSLISSFPARNLPTNVNDTSFIVQLGGVYEVNIFVLASNEAALGDVQPIAVQLDVNGSLFDPYVAQSITAPPGLSILSMACSASWLANFSNGAVVSLRNTTGSGLQFQAPITTGLNRTFSMKLVGR